MGTGAVASAIALDDSPTTSTAPHEASRQMGQGSCADLLALVGTTPHSARAMTGAQRAPGCRRRWQVFKTISILTPSQCLRDLEHSEHIVTQ